MIQVLIRQHVGYSSFRAVCNNKKQFRWQFVKLFTKIASNTLTYKLNMSRAKVHLNILLELLFNFLKTEITEPQLNGIFRQHNRKSDPRKLLFVHSNIVT